MAAPAELGYRMPAEWEPHAATWLSWPHDPLTFPDRVEKAEETYKKIIRALAPHERVNLLVKDADTHDKVQAWLAEERVKNVHLWEIPVADVWFRDYGPIFVTRTIPELSGAGDHEAPGAGQSGRVGLALTKWVFNAWGNKYETLLPDNNVPYELQPHLGLPMYEAGIVMEGGSLDVNGKGCLLTTEQCLLNPNRNPDLTRDAIEQKLKEFLGVTKILWLGDGIEGDDTDGHVDDVSRFVNPTTIVTAVEPDVNDPNHAPLRENLERLRRMTDQDGKPFTLVELPMPGNAADEEERLPMSYVNFYIANSVVLSPVFGMDNDTKAVEILGKCFPDRQVVPIDCSDLVWGMGTLHCITQQQPLAR